MLERFVGVLLDGSATAGAAQRKPEICPRTVCALAGVVRVRQLLGARGERETIELERERARVTQHGAHPRFVTPVSAFLSTESPSWTASLDAVGTDLRSVDADGIQSNDSRNGTDMPRDASVGVIVS